MKYLKIWSIIVQAFLPVNFGQHYTIIWRWSI